MEIKEIILELRVQVLFKLLRNLGVLVSSDAIRERAISLPDRETFDILYRIHRRPWYILYNRFNRFLKGL
jgi:hypothetical protein